MTIAVPGPPLVQRLFGAGDFPPFQGTELLDELRDEVLETRQAAFVALVLRLATVRDVASQGADDWLDEFLGLPRETRLAIVADPTFSIWIHQAARVEATLGAPEHAWNINPLSGFREVLHRCLGRIENVGGGLDPSVEILRYEVDPLIAEVAPPTYAFPNPDKARELEEQ